MQYTPFFSTAPRPSLFYNIKPPVLLRYRIHEVRRVVAPLLFCCGATIGSKCSPIIPGRHYRLPAWHLLSGLFVGRDSTRGSGQEGLKMSRVGSGHFEISRFRSGRVNKFANLAGRVGSGQQFFSKYRGSGRVASGGVRNLTGRVGSNSLHLTSLYFTSIHSTSLHFNSLHSKLWR